MALVAFRGEIKRILATLHAAPRAWQDPQHRLAFGAAVGGRLHKETVGADLGGFVVTLHELENMADLSPGLIRRAGNSIVDAIETAKSDDNDYAPPRPPDESQKALLKSMQKQVADCAENLGLAAETVASKRDLSAIILGGDRKSKVLSGWRRELIGEELLELL